jgi:L-fuculose-phosphate aldolase
MRRYTEGGAVAHAMPRIKRMKDRKEREALVAACREMNARGINQGTSGNISVRRRSNMLISPSAIPYHLLRPQDVATMPIAAGDYGTWHGPRKPSTEWRVHLDIMHSRPDAGAVVHSHPPYCTTLAIARREIPACHYMIAAFGGPDIRCAPYATFGTKELSDHALRALEGRSACLLANHGMIVVGATLERAMWLAVELEAIAKQYYQSLLIGGPVLLSEAEIADTAARFAGYGTQDQPIAVKRTKRKPTPV